MGRAVDAIVMGLGSYGSRIVEQLQARGKTVVGVDFDPQQLQRWRDRGVPVLYGDGTDPELYERLPLERTAWLASTLRSPPTNLAVLRILRQRRFAGYVALTAAGPDEVETYRRHGAHGVLCPFRDAADEAADALSHAPQILPAIAGWPLTFDEVRLRSDAACVGQRLRDVPVRAAAGASVVAVLRGGRILYSPEAEFTLYPGDHVVVAGGPDEVRRALELLSEPAGGAGESAESFAMKEIVVEPGAETAGKTLGEIEFRQRYRATVVGILRNGEYRLTPGPDERLAAGDRLLVLGPSDSDLTLPPASVTLTVESEQ
jgi:Trk K+ transport system NAD-binding subunit